MAELITLSSESDSDEIPEGNVDDDMKEMPGNQLLPCTHNNIRSASTAFVEAEFHILLQHGWKCSLASGQRFKREILNIC
jgi:hypothetical protein